MTDKHEHEQPHMPAPAKGARLPVAAHVTPHAAGEDDASAEANAHIAADIAKRASPPIPAEQLVTAPTSAPLVGGRAMYVLVGPYRGNVLTMTDADGESAKDNHWAIDIADTSAPFDANAPYDHDHELTDEDRAYAVKEANEWAAAQNPPPETDEDETAPEGETEDARREREMRNEGRRARAKQRDEQKAQRDKQQPKPGQHPAQQPDHQPGQQLHKGKAAEPKPAGTYETR